MKPALLTEKTAHGTRCLLCAHKCVLKDGQVGICKVRKNIDGGIVSLCYDRVAATHSDPIEKKPLYHFLPASTSYSIATMGCNFNCTFCQNHSLSMVRGDQGPPYGDAIAPEKLVKAALAHQSQSISYTYTEPTIYFELMIETARLAKEAGIKNVMVTNGFMSEEALAEIAPYMDAANIDLKAFRDEFYKKYCAARLDPVLQTIRGMKQAGIWIELTTLMIPGLNDDPRELKELTRFILDVDESIPWHVSRFYPQHKMNDIPATDPDAMFEALETAGEMGLKYLYAGNVFSGRWGNTHCPACDALLIERSGYFTDVSGMENGTCGSCNHEIAGVWK
jgi:pyruvate formate lyase activating enzyme